MKTNKDIGTVLNNKLRELNDSPDEIVWTNIKNELAKKKRRRFFIILLLVLLLVTISLIYRNTEKKKVEKKLNLTEIPLKEKNTFEKLGLSIDVIAPNSEKIIPKISSKQKNEKHFAFKKTKKRQRC